MQLKYHGLSYDSEETKANTNVEGLSGVYRGQAMTFSRESQRPIVEQHQLTYRGVSYPEVRDRQRLTQRSMEPSLST